MAGKRLKTPVVKLNREDAEAALGRVGENLREIQRIELEASEQIEAIKSAAKQRTDNLAKAVKADFVALTGWAAENREQLLADGRRTIPMTHGQVGWRWSPPAVKVKADDEPAVVATLQRLKLDHLLRTRVELNREAILEEPGAVEGIAGISIERVETFWAKPAELDLEQKAQARKLTGAEAVESAKAPEAAA